MAEGSVEQEGTVGFGGGGDTFAEPPSSSWSCARLTRLEEVTAALRCATSQEAVAEVIRGLTTVARRLERVKRTTAALAAAGTPAEIARAVVHEAREALDATRAVLAVPTGDKRTLEILGQDGEAAWMIRPLLSFGVDDPVPAARAFRDGECIWIATQAEVEARFPPAGWNGSYAPGTIVCFPLIVRACTIGVLSFGFGAEGALDADGFSAAEEIAQHTAVALDRAMLHAAYEQERKQSEAELRRAYEIAREADRRKDEFLALLGHELRNPLSPILTALYLMRIKGAAAAERECQVIERQVHHLVSLVDDLLDISRITRGKIKLSVRPIELGCVLERAIEMASPLLEQKRHNLVVDVPAGLVVEADETRLAQVLSNLLTNAANYTDAGGHVSVAARREGDRIIIAVRDDGIGIPPELLPVVFELFVQGERGVDRAGGGLGLGLGLVRSFVSLHGGEVFARSEGTGRGSEFEVHLPVCPEGATQEAPRAPDVSRGPMRARRVLVVDDNMDAARLLADVLLEQGHEVRFAHDGPQALGLVSDFCPEVAILDIGLPVMDGYELALELRAALGPSVTLVAVTGYGQESDKRRAYEAGFSRHYAKPVDTPTLLREVFV